MCESTKQRNSLGKLLCWQLIDAASLPLLKFSVMACEWLFVLFLFFSVCRSLSLSLSLSLLSQINGFILIINECTCISAFMGLPINFVLCFFLQRNGTIADFVSFYTLPSTIMHTPTQAPESRLLFLQCQHCHSLGRPDAGRSHRGEKCMCDPLKEVGWLNHETPV